MDKNTQVSVHPSRNAKLVNYVGWTGHRNIGDEALYDVIQKVFSPYELVPTTNSLARARPQLCSGVTLFGGGTLLPRWAASVMPNRFNYAYGVGVVDPDFYRYQYGTHDMTVYDLAVQKTRKFNFRLLGVRGARSKKLLDSWGIKSFIVGDPCLLLRPSSLLKKREDLVAISVGSSEPYEPVWGKTEDVAREVSKLCSILTKKGYTLVLVPFSDVDMPHIQRVAEETGLPIFEGYENIQSLLDFVSTCHILVGQRL
ncbi:MAG TPA: polysaccharide pyruvyl transferase family protein, partial [Candidatus Bathyarchaeia archaeon]|nr:polysaccharide pyruvyl transferase family protein [Candidatus Bathyarchaeia archaeon]